MQNKCTMQTNFVTQLKDTYLSMYIKYTFLTLSNYILFTNILYFWGSDPLINGDY